MIDIIIYYKNKNWGKNKDDIIGSHNSIPSLK